MTFLADDEQNDNPLKSKFVITRQRAAWRAGGSQDGLDTVARASRSYLA
jgi:hypothetical protein